MKKPQLSQALAAAGSVGVIILLSVHSSHAAAGTAASLELCRTVVIPSLFPMLIASSFLVESGGAGMLGKLLSPVTRRVFALPGEAGVAVIMSIFGGYPTGAGMICSLYDKGIISPAQASRMALFCVSAGPAFLIGTVGSMLMGNAAAGVLLLIVQALTVVTIGVLLRFILPCEPVLRRRDCPPAPRGGLVTAVLSASRAMLSVCLFVIAFGIISTLLGELGIPAAVSRALCALGLPQETARSLLPAVLEVTGGCVAASRAGLPMVAFAVGFGGLSVHFQIFALLKKIKISPPLFIAVRLIQGLLSCLLTSLTVGFLPESSVAAMSSQVKAELALPDATGAALLVIMCLMCAMCLPERNSGHIYSRRLSSSFNLRLCSMNTNSSASSAQGAMTISDQ